MRAPIASNSRRRERNNRERRRRCEREKRSGYHHTTVWIANADLEAARQKAKFLGINVSVVLSAAIGWGLRSLPSSFLQQHDVAFRRVVPRSTSLTAWRKAKPRNALGQYFRSEDASCNAPSP